MSNESNGLFDLYEMLEKIKEGTDCDAYINIYSAEDRRLLVKFINSDTGTSIWSASLTLEMLEDSAIPPTQIMKTRLQELLNDYQKPT